MQVTYGLIRGQQVINSTEGQLIVTTAKVSGLTVIGPNDQAVLSRVSPFLPSIFTSHPDNTNYPNATLRQYRIASIDRANGIVFVDLVYRAPGISDWQLSTTATTEYLETFMTGRGLKVNTVWYKSGASSTATSPPSGVKPTATAVPKIAGKRILKAHGWASAHDWNAIKNSVYDAVLSINSTVWGTDPINDSEGTWIFLPPIIETHDLGRTFNIDLYFTHDPGGWYPISIYRQIDGRFPDDGVTEAQIRATWESAPRAVGDMLSMNGLTICSEYEETNFNNLFSFWPAQI